MTTVNNNDILFDDMAEIMSQATSNSFSNPTISYGDCSNRFEIPTVANDDHIGYFKTAINYGDCSN